MTPPAATAPDALAKPGREPRSRHDRPCDMCRRHKHLCMIPVRGEPCVSCATRKKACTFDMPPTQRKRKPKADVDAEPLLSPSGPSQGPVAASSSTTSAAQRKSRDRTTAYQQRDASLAQPPTSDPAMWAHLDNGPFRAIASQSPNGVPRAAIALPPPPPISYAPDMDDRDEHPPSLDPQDGEEEESHFVGTRAFFGLMLKEGADGQTPEQPRTTFERLATLAFRQVSADPRLPAYFIKHPSLLYGRGPSSAKNALEAVWDICATVGSNIPARAIDKLKRVTSPALPFISSRRLDLAIRTENSGPPVPYALLAGIVAHATIYIPETVPMHKELWAQSLLALEDEYRQPRLRVIQLALLILTSRPNENTGQNGIALARAVGTAHLLGLHIDPTHWNLPRWERSVRKRLWWVLVIHDKWRALLHGRPSNIHGSDFNVTLPAIHDADAGTDTSPEDTLSFESFIATCQLTMLIDKLLKQFYTVQAIMHPATGLTRVAGLEAFRAELDDFGHSLPPGLRLWPDEKSGTLPTGVRSFQVSFCGILVVTNRLIVESMTDRPGPHTAMGLNNALIAAERLADLVLHLTPEDRMLFWMPYTSYHISNGATLLLRIALCDLHGELHVRDPAIDCTVRLVKCLVDTCLEPSWDIARAALRRIATPLLIASRELPQLADTYAAVAIALNLPTHNNAVPGTADQLLESLGLGVGPADWLEADLSWLNADFMAPLGDAGGLLF